MFHYGLEVLLADSSLLKDLKNRRIALLAHPASVDQSLNHSLDLLRSKLGDSVCAAFGPQHGMRGEKQDNMIESDDYRDPVHNIPVYSLYGKVRRPTPEMLESFDVLLVDLQDVGCRIYTFLTTLFYMIDAIKDDPKKEIWVLDRPNPAGRNIEGNVLNMQFESFVGAAPVPMRHGLTLGEAGQWYVEHKGYPVNYRVIKMQDYKIESEPWPSVLSWVNPSPNMPRLSCVRQYAGTVLIEGTHLSEGRGTTTPLEIIGAPQMRSADVVELMHSLAPEWLKGCRLRPCYFEPTFHKFKGDLCSAIQIHADGDLFHYDEFKPYRLVCLFLKAFHQLHPEFNLFKSPPYEYEEKLLPIDILSGGEELRRWVEQKEANISEFDQFLKTSEDQWKHQSQRFLLY